MRKGYLVGGVVFLLGAVAGVSATFLYGVWEDRCGRAVVRPSGRPSGLDIDVREGLPALYMMPGTAAVLSGHYSLIGTARSEAAAREMAGWLFVEYSTELLGIPMKILERRGCWDVLVGPYADKKGSQSLCSALKAAGTDCSTDHIW